jgi:hypothetical protein
MCSFNDANHINNFPFISNGGRQVKTEWGISGRKERNKEAD